VRGFTWHAASAAELTHLYSDQIHHRQWHVGLHVRAISIEPAHASMQKMTNRLIACLPNQIRPGVCVCVRVRHSNATRALIENPPNSAQLGGIPYHFSKLHPGPYNSVGIRLRRGSHRQTHRRA